MSDIQLYNELTTAFDYYNARLFDNKLPACILTLSRSDKYAGYFVEGIWNKEGQDKSLDEIALNPSLFSDRTTEETLSTLVHEMCHMYQFAFLKASRKGYHNGEFANLMETVGLQCSSTGEEGGKTTGQKMSHYILNNGNFDINTKELLDSGFKLSYKDTWDQTKTKKVATTKKNKIKYTCSGCDSNAWAKPAASLICGSCYDLSSEVVKLTPEGE